ncbi:Protein strawberry notch-like protein 1 [Dichanthelium oligosanthes]|uniref:Protein strawberry notch-like protein 1 n=1 Tax=Dichanthelium oligosanthes TaxID=888268 RepID=A0A1E5UZU6_9POAL|nr:Protein strawberry notch-like protein 1 [Dichanthelium oligosanthes]
MAGGSSPSPAAAPVQVRCAGCRGVLAVGPGMTEFICPKCRMAQRLPPQLMPKSTSSSSSSPPPKSPAKPSLPPSTQSRRGAPPAQGVDPTKIQLPCAHCQAVLNVPHGLARFRCPQCGVDLAVDHAKLQNFLASSNSAPPSGPDQVPPVPFLPMLPPGVAQPLQLVAGATIPMVLPAAEPPEEINEVAIDVEREEDEGGTVGETFTDYKPPKLSLGLSHPDPVVETSSLSAVQPPEPTYNLNIMDELDETKALSCLQIETIVYACQRHLYHLPTGDRAGFFIGDGAGVGKGRTIAGLIWENWQQGRHKAVWVSVGSDLKYDARRDLDDVGAKCVQVHPLNKLPYSKLDSKAIGIKNGVIFVTYSSLIASSERGRSRLQQLVQWCGHEFDGLLVFDECHKAKNLIPDAGSQPTRTGKAVLEIQLLIVYGNFSGALEKGGVGALELVAMDMKARGMYVCRTLSYKGADFDIVEAPLEERMMNMYRKAAEFWANLRLELISASEFFAEEKGNSNQIWRLYWASHQRFFRHMCMSAKVPAVVRLAKEALAENKSVVIGLQSTGEARTEEAVTKYGIEMEDFVSGPRELLLKLVEENYPMPPKPDSFQQGEEKVTEIQRKRHSALDVSFKGRVRKVAKVVDVSDDDTDDYSPSESDHESTESDEEFHMCQICNTEEEKSLLLHCSGCSRHVHPNCLTPPWTGMMTDDWACYTCKIVEDEDKEQDAHVADFSKRYDTAVEKKSKILDIIRSLDLPNNPLDDIIDQVVLFIPANKLGGPDNVAEITGRRGMLIRASDGKGVVYQARNAKEVSMEMINMHEKQLFMDGKKLIAIISEAGSAGVSLHADRRAKNQDSFPVVPPGCSDDEASIQQFINEAKGALISVGIIRDAVVCNGKDAGKLSGRIVDSDMHDVARFLNRLLGLAPYIQNRLFDLFTSILDVVLHDARIEGQLDSGIVDIKAKNVEMKESPKTVHTDSLSGALTVLFTFTIDRGVTWEYCSFTCIIPFLNMCTLKSAKALLEERQKDGASSSNDGFYESRREWMGRRHFTLAFEGSTEGMYKIIRPAIGEALREMPSTELKSKYRKVSSIDKVSKGWQEEYDASSKQCMHGSKCKIGSYCTVGRRLQEVNILGGLILPVWGTIEKALAKQVRQVHKRIRVVRLVTTNDNQRIVGLLIPNSAVESVLTGLQWVQDIDD